MLFTSSSDGTTVTPTTPPDNGTDPTANSCVDAGMCESLHVKKLCIHTINCLFSFIAITILPTGLIAGIVVVCVVVYLLTFLAGCGVGVIGHVVYQKKSKQSTGVLCEHSSV